MRIQGRGFLQYPRFGKQYCKWALEDEKQGKDRERGYHKCVGKNKHVA